MPGGNRTWPRGDGAMTGRGMGYCSGFQEPGFWHPGPRRRYGRGQGLGFGRAQGWSYFGRFRRHPMPYWPPYAPHEGTQMAHKIEIEHLKEESSFLKEELNRIEQRINGLEGENE